MAQSSLKPDTDQKQKEDKRCVHYRLWVKDWIRKRLHVLGNDLMQGKDPPIGQIPDAINSMAVKAGLEWAKEARRTKTREDMTPAIFLYLSSVREWKELGHDLQGGVLLEAIGPEMP